MADQVSVAVDVAKLVVSKDSMGEVVLDDAFIEGPHSVNISGSDVSFLPPFTFEPHEDGYDSESTPRTSMELDSGFHAGLRSLPDPVLHAFGGRSKNDVDALGESGLGNTEVFSIRTKQFSESNKLSRPMPTSPQIETLRPELGPGLQIPVFGETGRISHARCSSGCSDSSTLLGTEDENEEFPMRKDRKEDVIQVIEIPIVRKRRSTILGKLKQTLGSPPRSKCGH